MANTLKDIQKDISNDAVRRLVDLTEFTGELPPRSPVQGSSYGYTSGGSNPIIFKCDRQILICRLDGNATRCR